MANVVRWGALRPYAKVGIGVVEAGLRRAGRTQCTGASPESFEAAARLGARLFPRAETDGHYVIFQASRCGFSAAGDAGAVDRNLYLASMFALSEATDLVFAGTVAEVAARGFDGSIAHMTAILPEHGAIAPIEAALFNHLVQRLAVGGTLSVLAADQARVQLAATAVRDMRTRDETATLLGIELVSLDVERPLYFLSARRFASVDASITYLEATARAAG
ncbi:MAG: hypothetical protein HY696_07905 [Deltaproteobacteria bacterium]|nr:hypothetical protein [Deltaproteobacteria bacterium]